MGKRSHRRQGLRHYNLIRLEELKENSICPGQRGGENANDHTRCHYFDFEQLNKAEDYLDSFLDTK